MGLIFVCLASLSLGAVGFAIASFKRPLNPIVLKVNRFAHWVGCGDCR